jgi:hypothetical protein
MDNAYNNPGDKKMANDYVDVAQTARLLRAELRRTFPRVKFSVRSHRYAGGARVNVHLDDAAVETSAVREVTAIFTGIYTYVFVRNDADVYEAN